MKAVELHLHAALFIMLYKKKLHFEYIIFSLHFWHCRNRNLFFGFRFAGLRVYRNGNIARKHEKVKEKQKLKHAKEQANVTAKIKIY